MASRFVEIKRSIINKRNRKKLKNQHFSLIASNCHGACILHDLGLEFNSPMVNLWMKPKEFLKFVSNLNEYLRAEVLFSDEEEQQYGYPVGVLNDDVYIYFQHYHGRTEAKEKWEERKRRIIFENMFILFSDRDGCTYEDLVEFDNLPFKNKIVFTHKEYPELRSAYCISGFEQDETVGLCMNFINKYSAKKYYDAFPYVKWFNGELDN